jgi:hypothetical protein
VVQLPHGNYIEKKILHKIQIMALWLTPAILSTREAELRRFQVSSGKKFMSKVDMGIKHEALSSNPSTAKKIKSSRALVADACNSSASGGRDQEALSSKPARANSS